MKVLAHEGAEGFFRRTRRRTVVVSQVEMRDAEVERTACDGSAVLEHIDVTEVVPQTQRDGRQAHAAGPDAVVFHRLVTRVCWLVFHESYSVFFTEGFSGGRVTSPTRQTKSRARDPRFHRLRHHHPPAADPGC